MRLSSFRSSFALTSLAAAAALAAGCGLIAGIKDRTLTGGAGGSGGSTSSPSSSTGVSASVGGAGGQEPVTGAVTGTTTGGSTGGGGAGGSSLCPPQSALVDTLACNQQKPSSLAIFGGTVYWTNEGDGTVHAVAAMGGSADTTLANKQGTPCGIVVGGAHVYWRTREGFVRRQLLGSTMVEDVDSDQGDSCAISADGTSVYWVKVTTVDNDVIRSAFFANPGAKSDVVLDAKQATSLDATGLAAVYFTAPGKQSVYSGGKANGGVSLIGTGTTSLCAVAVGAGKAFWTDSAPGQVWQADLDGTNRLTIATGQAAPCAVAPHAPYVYWANRVSAGSIHRILKGDAGAPELLVGMQGEPCSIAVGLSGDYVYWTNCGSGEVLRLAVSP